MKQFLWALAAWCLVAGAPEARALSKIDLKPPAHTDDDPDSATSLLYQKPKSGTGRGVASVGAAGCTDGMGVTYQKDAAGYAACMRYQNKDKPELAPPAQGGGSVGITFGK